MSPPSTFSSAGYLNPFDQSELMQQLVQSLKTGVAELQDAPAPSVKAGSVVIKLHRSLISSGTERMLAEFGRANWAQKARQQPDKVRDVLNKVRADGLIATAEAVQAKLDAPIPVGYSSVGHVIAVGTGVDRFAVGDRVASNGPHAQVVRVSHNLCARVPDSVPDDAAAFTVLGAIALQGIRLVQPTLGESFVVTGLGLIGLLTVQLLRANGCRVLGIDFDQHRLQLARDFGAEVVDLSANQDPVAAARAFSRGRGVDGVLLTLATSSSDPVRQAAIMCRKRGRIVLVGVSGLELSRADFYEKELTFQVSCSYGPGRNDSAYEDRGQDYPFGFVRWTEQRNFEAVLDLLSLGTLNVAPLISHRFAFDSAPDAYGLLTSSEPSLGILLEYPECGHNSAEVPFVAYQNSVAAGARPLPTVSVIGAGNYASRVLVPAFRDAGTLLHSVVTTSGTSGVYVARKFGFRETTTDVSRAFGAETDIVVIATPHDSHADLAVRALEAGKHVFVEKPLAINNEGLDAILETYRAAQVGGLGPLLMVGFNRRFSPHVTRVRRWLEAVPGPRAFVMTVNAGAIPREHWTQQQERGGGRIVGEACHFVDLLRHLAGHPIVAWSVVPLIENGRAIDDVASFTLSFADGSHGTVHYFANGHKAFPKERLEIFSQGRILQLDNFRRLRTYGGRVTAGRPSLRQDKGNSAGVASFVAAVREGGSSPIPIDELIEVSRVSIALADAARSR